MQAGVGTSCAQCPECCRAGEQIQRHVFILQADPGPAQITFVDVLPKADGDFADALNVGGAGACCEPLKPTEFECCLHSKARRPRERTIAPAALYATDSPGLGLGLLLAVIDIDVVAGERMSDSADHELQRRDAAVPSRSVRSPRRPIGSMHSGRYPGRRGRCPAGRRISAKRASARCRRRPSRSLFSGSSSRRGHSVRAADGRREQLSQ